MEPRIEGGMDLAAETPSCDEREDRYRYNAGTHQSESFHVVETNQNLEVTLFLRTLVIPNPGPPFPPEAYCDMGTWAY